MRPILLSLLALFGAACLAQAVPELTIDRAAAAAQKELKDRGLDGHIYVFSLTLEADGVLNKQLHWTARWSEAIPGDERTKEIGLRINMDGNTVRLVEGPGSVDALRNPRTRSDRPSILDLKH
jgi:hypothetical protein